MKISCNRSIILLILIIFTTRSQSSWAQENVVFDTSSRQTLTWSELIFKGSKMFTSLIVKVRLSSGDQLSNDISKETGGGPDYCSETSSEIDLLTIQVSSKVAGFSQSQYEEKIWFDKTAARPDSRVRINSGDAPWIKSYCWEKKGVHRQKFQPGNTSEIKEPPVKWTKNTAEFYMYPEKVTECRAISDPSLVFFLLTNIKPDSQLNPHEICVFGKKQLHQLKIKEEKYSPLKVSYKERSLSQDNIVEEQIFPVAFSVNTENIAPESTEPETFSFLGLQKDIRIYVDPKKRLPVRITGTNNIIGRLVLDLRTYSK